MKCIVYREIEETHDHLVSHQYTSPISVQKPPMYNMYVRTYGSIYLCLSVATESSPPIFSLLMLSRVKTSKNVLCNVNLDFLSDVPTCYI